METKGILREFKAQLDALYGERLEQVILSDSWARGEATDESDIDLVVVLEGQLTPGKEVDRMIDSITDMNLK